MTSKSTPLVLWIVLPAGDPVEPGPARLLKQLVQDSRYKIAAVKSAARQPAALPALLRAVLFLENKLIRVRPRYSSDLTYAGHSDLPVLSVVSAQDGAEAPDIIIDFTMSHEVTQLAPRARLGLWRLDAYLPMAGLEAVMLRQPLNWVRLYSDDGAKQCQIAQAGYDTKRLASHSIAYLREKSVQLIVSELAKYHLNKPSLTENIAHPEVVKPGGGMVLRYLACCFIFGVSRLSSHVRRLRGLTPNQFCLSVGLGDVLTFDPATALETAPRQNTFWADPFLIENKGTTWCFFEEYDYRKCIGQIAVGRLTDGGVDYVGPALTTGYHTSFPFVFFHDGDFYMIPETVGSARIEIWQAVDFPTGWTLYSTALNGQRAADTTLTFIKGEWWLFTNIGHDGFGDNCNELCIFRTSGPDLAWIEPHALNPVVIGADRARNGGRFFERGGLQYRMAQDNSGGRYGFGLKVMEIVALSLTEYSERCVRHIKPEFREGVIGCHHFDSDGTHFVMDVLRR